MVEEMVKSGLPVVVVDPIGVWWGLRSSADGAKPGLLVAIIGGEHGDVPVEPTAGHVVADVLVDSPSPVVLDLSEMRKGEARRFVTDFLEQLYRRNREPLHVVLDEADEFAPQRPQRGSERLLGACEDLVRRGRARGLGVTHHPAAGGDPQGRAHPNRGARRPANHRPPRPGSDRRLDQGPRHRRTASARRTPAPDLRATPRLSPPGLLVNTGQAVPGRGISV